MTQRSESYLVEGMSCDHCRASVDEELAAVAGVERVTVDLASGRVEVRGEGFRDEQVEAAVRDAGYELAGL